MALSIKSALLMSALAGIVAANPLPDATTTTANTASACTSTSTTAIWAQSAPTNMGGVVTFTSYTATATTDVEVDCGGCRFLAVEPSILGHPRPHGPIPHLVAVETASGTITLTQAYCSGSSPTDSPAIVNKLEIGGDGVFETVELLEVANPTVTQAPDCTARVFQVPKFTFGPTRTIWTTTVTQTRDVNCGRCTNFSPVPVPFGVPPVALFNTTVTVTGASTAIKLACGTTRMLPF